MFSKSQRSVLGKLSATIWQSESRWQKLYDAGQLDVVESSTEVDEEVDQIQLANGKGQGRGTILNKATAQSKGLWRDTPETTKVAKSVKRTPSFEELVASLSELARATLYSFMTPEQLINALAVDLVGGETVKVKFEYKDDEAKTTADGLLTKLPEGLKAGMVSVENGIPVDAVEYLSEVLFASTHPVEAKDIYSQSLDLAALQKRTMIRKMNMKNRLGL